MEKGNSKKYPRVAVIVLNYNGKHLLKESLGSLSKQSYPNYQLYLADDCSTDDSVEFVEKKFPNVKIIKGPRNFGPAGISNYAVSKTKEEYLILMSNDMKFDKNCVKYLVETIINDKTIGICSSGLVKYEKGPQRNLHLIDNAGGELDIYGFGIPHSSGKPFVTYPKKTEEVFFSYGGSFIIPRRLFTHVGGFDDRFFGLSDDIDLSWRVRLLGYKIVVNPRSFLYHHISPTLGKIKRRKTRYMSERNSLRMMLKNYSFGSLIKILPRYFLLETGEVGFYIIKRRFDLAVSITRAIGWNVINLPDTMRLRKRIQKIRKVDDEFILNKLNHKSHKIQILPRFLKMGIFER